LKSLFFWSIRKYFWTYIEEVSDFETLVCKW
jgi:hypothetical protein